MPMELQMPVIISKKNTKHNALLTPTVFGITAHTSDVTIVKRRATTHAEETLSTSPWSTVRKNAVHP